MNTAEIYHFMDDGVTPNNSLPVVVYRKVIEFEPEHAADWLEDHFEENGWTNAFRWRVYDYHHYHSNTHEVLGIYSGTATLQLGGEQGQQLEFHAGDVLILPAGTGHRSIQHSKDFSVVGAYPDGKEPDLIRLEDKWPEDVRGKIAQVGLPQHDPVYAQSADGLLKIWK
ncbi:cupin domain-containing protein [Pedobacter sp. ASV1-7]|uniref:cupin domain-containing protein n=1 Tax=Pedobacter sp. ASV1-7 TaxID=3145237 RepID=UPI0032E8FFD5